MNYNKMQVSRCQKNNTKRRSQLNLRSRVWPFRIYFKQRGIHIIDAKGVRGLGTKTKGSKKQKDTNSSNLFWLFNPQIKLNKYIKKKNQGPSAVHFKWRNSPSRVHLKWRNNLSEVHFTRRFSPSGVPFKWRDWPILFLKEMQSNLPVSNVLGT